MTPPLVSNSSMTSLTTDSLINYVPKSAGASLNTTTTTLNTYTETTVNLPKPHYRFASLENAQLPPPKEFNSNIIYFTQKESESFFSEDNAAYQDFNTLFNAYPVSFQKLQLTPLLKPQAWENSEYYLSHVFVQCVKKDDSETLNKILSRGLHPDMRLYALEYPLSYYAIDQRAHRVLDTLLQHGASAIYVDQSWNSGDTQRQEYSNLLFHSIECGNIEAFKKMCRMTTNSFDAAQTDKFNKSLFFPLSRLDKNTEIELYIYLLETPGIERVFHQFYGQLNILTMALHPERTHLFDILLQYTENPRDLELFIDEINTKKPHFLSFRDEYEEIFEAAKTQIQIKLEKLKLFERVQSIQQNQHTGRTAAITTISHTDNQHSENTDNVRGPANIKKHKI